MRNLNLLKKMNLWIGLFGMIFSGGIFSQSSDDGVSFSSNFYHTSNDSKAASWASVADSMNDRAVNSWSDSKAGRDTASSSAQECGCCEYYNSAVYGEMYNSNGGVLKEGSKEWCAENKAKRLDDEVSRYISSVRGNELLKVAEKKAAIHILERQLRAKSSSLDEKKLLNDLTNSGLGYRNSWNLLSSSKGVFGSNGLLDNKKLELTWQAYKKVIDQAPESVVKAPPSSLLAYKALFVVLNENKLK